MPEMFDWLRWVEVPVWLGICSWLIAHARHDHAVEVTLASALGKLETLENTMNTLLQSLLLERNSND